MHILSTNRWYKNMMDGETFHCKARAWVSPQDVTSLWRYRLEEWHRWETAHRNGNTEQSHCKAIRRLFLKTIQKYIHTTQNILIKKLWVARCHFISMRLIWTGFCYLSSACATWIKLPEDWKSDMILTLTWSRISWSYSLFFVNLTFSVSRQLQVTQQCCGQTSQSVSDSALWTLPTSKVRLPVSFPLQHHGHVTGLGQDLLQLSAERLHRVELSVEGLDLLRAEERRRLALKKKKQRLTVFTGTLGAASVPVTPGVNVGEILVHSLLRPQGIIQLVVLWHKLLQHTLHQNGTQDGEGSRHIMKTYY